jgi:hypothetical protein
MGDSETVPRVQACAPGATRADSVKEDPEFVTSSRSDLIALIVELRVNLERERQRVAELEKALALARQASTKAWQMSIGGTA